MSPSKHVLVTGGAGFIGSHLVERLLADGKAVVVLDDFSTGSRANLATVDQNPKLRLIEGKISTCAELPRLVAGAESIYHLAAAVGVDLVVRSPIHVLATNLTETQVLLEAAAQHQVPTLIASTSEVYGKSEKEAFQEDDDLIIGSPQHARWSYACSKLMDEFWALAYAKERALPVAIVRMFNTVGPRQTGKFGMVLPRFIAAAKAGTPVRVFGDGRQSRCFCYIADTIEALVRLQNTPAARGQIVNIGNTEEVSMAELARKVIATLGARSEVEFVPYDQAYAPGFDDMRRRKPDVSKLERMTGFKPQTSLEEIIRRTAATI
jgi:UDP-glucose 4-epimerase